MITIFSDPHIGLNRVSGTSPPTRELIRRNILNAIPIANDNLICGGDLVDTYTNREHTIKDAFKVYQRLALCLAGNHDLHNSSEAVGTAQLLGALNSEPLMVNKFGKAGAYKRTIDGVKIVVVPHCSNSDLFFDSLCQADEMGGDWLVTHCNFDSPVHHDLSDTELNLTKENAEELLKTFKFILLGHIHNPAEHFGGRLKIIGGVYPTSFNDMKSKRYLTYENGEFTSHETWSSDKYVECDWKNLTTQENTEFVRLSGKRTQAEGKDFLHCMNLLRKSGNVLAIKDDTVLEGMQTEVTAAEHPMKLSETIRESLKKQPEELKLWDELQEEITA